MRRFALILAALACATSPITISTTAMAGQTVLVFAAASTRDAMEAAIQAFHSIDIPKTDIRGVYAATSALSRQIIDGAPASIFLSANQAWTDQLEKSGLIRDRRNFLKNSLVLIAPKSTPRPPPIRSPADMIPALSSGRLAIAETKGVPAGIYARQALETLRVWPSLKDRLAQTANVRAALLLVERGEVPLGLVYRTDALASPEVTEIWAVPTSAHAPIVYPLALLTTPANNPKAAAFFAFLASPAGRKIFAAHGFETD
jgi:molybdate transport system substrate-binding protein